MGLFSFLGSPAVIAVKDAEIAFLTLKLNESEQERRLLLDSLLVQRGVTPLAQMSEPMPEPFQQATAFDSWEKNDIKAEIEELAQLAQMEPDTYGPLLEEALIRYRDELK